MSQAAPQAAAFRREVLARPHAGGVRGPLAAGLERDGLLVGVNWTGARATGYDVEPGDVRRRLDAPP